MTALRELAEEAGFAADRMELLTRTAISPGFCDQRSSVYLATGLTPVPVDRQGVEEGYMRVEEIPLDRDRRPGGRRVDHRRHHHPGLGLARRRLAGTR